MTAQHPRFTQALWYAWGQQDAGIGTDVDADQFALNHAHAAEQMDAGKLSFLPSIQSAWADYIARHSFVQVRR